ncbi:prepilin-type N-terminal cleavage/methylation domain-containing protein [Deinococcota bacterium DY0809b]
MAKRRGFTLLELLLVLALASIVLGLGAVSFQSAMARERAKGAVSDLRQAVWGGASFAASRGEEYSLVFDGSKTVRLVRSKDGKVVRTVELPDSVTLDEPAGELMRFTSPGMVKFNANVGRFLDLTVDGKTQQLEVSKIGEVRVVVP